MKIHRLIIAVLISTVLASAAACSSPGTAEPQTSAAEPQTSAYAASQETAVTDGPSAEDVPSDDLPPDDLSSDELSPDDLSSDELSPDDLSSDDLSSDELSQYALSYEVKLLLDSQKVLNDDHLLKEEWIQAFGITEDYLPIEVMYLDTPEKDFLHKGWINRLRLKSGKKKAERTYKKRYPVAGADLAAACEAAKKDGFIIPDKSESTEQTDGKEKEAADELFEAGIDWGYEKMTLSLSYEDSAKLKGHDSLASMTGDEARDFLLDAMPDIEANWEQSQWGISAMERAEAAGPVRFMRAKGELEGLEITVEICSVTEKNSDEESYIVELSFDADDYPAAADGKAQLMEYLDQKEILLHEDSLKTTKILDAWF